MSFSARCTDLSPTDVLCLLTGSSNIASGQQSDHLLMAAAYDAWATAKHKVDSHACVSPPPNATTNRHADPILSLHSVLELLLPCAAHLFLIKRHLMLCHALCFCVKTFV